MGFRGRVAILALSASVAACDPPSPDGVPIPGDDFVVTGAVKIRPGVYRVADANGDGVIHMQGDGASLDLTGVTLIGSAEGAAPDTFSGVGISVDGAKGLTITGGIVRGYKIGVRVHGSPSALLTGIDASGNFRQHLRSTVEREDESDWLFGHENDDGQWERNYGAGISLAKCPDSQVTGCVVHEGQNGVLLDRCDGSVVESCDFSFNSGWGIALWRTSKSVVCGNSADWCVRGYSHGKYARGQDSAGIFVFEQCSDNWFVSNSATHGGDGFFLYAGNETLKKTGTGGCNRNVVWNCDFSHAVANGIEATFSTKNIFSRNRLDDCEHGVWAGYSSDTEIYGNTLRNCANGVSIEHGRRNWISTNVFDRCGTAVHLWWDEDADLAKSEFGKRNDLASRGNAIGPDNEFGGNRVDVRLAGDRRSAVYGNAFAKPPVFEIPAESKASVHPATDDPAFVFRDAAATMSNPDLQWAPRPVTRDPFLPEGTPRGRRFVLVDDWGPVPPGESRLFPAVVDATGAATFSALGVEKSFEVTSLTEGFVAEPNRGELPATISVRRTDGGATPKPFDISVKCGGRVHHARGTVSSMPWDVSFFQWTKDPRTDADAWKALLSGEPVEKRRVDGLDFSWKSGAVSEKVGADHFGTLATSELVTTKGKWRLSTVSDDGIRVWVDGKLVIDDWTLHGPTPHDADLSLEAGSHAIRVEHFEIDGWAALQVRLTPVGN